MNDIVQIVESNLEKFEVPVPDIAEEGEQKTSEREMKSHTLTFDQQLITASSYREEVEQKNKSILRFQQIELYQISFLSYRYSKIMSLHPIQK